MSTSAALRPAARGLLQTRRASQTALSPPFFLLPFSPVMQLHHQRQHQHQQQQTSSFSISTQRAYPRDNNRERGVSTQRRTGLRSSVSVTKTPLPQPVLDASRRSKIVVDPDHGLYQFFHNSEKAMNTPEEDSEHGRAWCVEELRAKSWEDLHALWWVCCKEKNRIATESFERKRLEAGYGDFESQERNAAVRLTQRAIKQVLTERYYSWRDAETIAKEDPEINLESEGPVYTPSEFMEEEPVTEATKGSSAP